MSEVAIVAALEDEVRNALKGWRVCQREFDGRRYRFFENDDRAVLVCGGIGPGPARRACEAVIALYSPKIVVSLGFAGALEPELQVAQPFVPARVIDVRDGRVFTTGVGKGVLLTFGSIAGAQQKEKLAKAYGGDAVDMEAAAVAEGAEARRVDFMAYKAITDPAAFEFPELERFIDSDGHFHKLRFCISAVFRPWLWARIVSLAINSSRASKTLCQWINEFSERTCIPQLVTDPKFRYIASSRS